MTREAIREERDYLKSVLPSKEAVSRMVKYEDAIFQIAMMHDFEHFVYGFQLGARLMGEIYGGEDYTEN